MQSQAYRKIDIFLANERVKQAREITASISLSDLQREVQAIVDNWVNPETKKKLEKELVNINGNSSINSEAKQSYLAAMLIKVSDKSTIDDLILKSKNALIQNIKSSFSTEQIEDHIETCIENSTGEKKAKFRREYKKVKRKYRKKMNSEDMKPIVTEFLIKIASKEQIEDFLTRG